MFPVPGFSVSAAKLKSETGSSAAAVKKDPAAAAAIAPAKTRRKRKGAPGASDGSLQQVTEENLAYLWEKIIERKEAGTEKEKRRRPKAPTDEEGQGEEEEEEEKEEDGTRPKKKHKKQRPENGSPATVAKVHAAEEDADDALVKEAGPTAKGKKRKTKDKQVGPVSSGHANNRSAVEENKYDSTAAQPDSAPAPKSQVKLTPLQASMREKLVSARFRHLNETLYTRPSAEAFRLFQDSPEMFSQYHEGFRRQVDVWPENPLTGYIEEVKERAKVRGDFPRNVHGRKPSSALLPLPRDRRNDNTCTIADLGCGDAALASALRPLQKKLRVEVRSFDLHKGGSDLVTRADISNLPLADESVDVAVFCLALMGTNWVDFIEEAYRVLRWKGELWVAEIKSRFASGKAGRKKIVPHSVGHRRNAGAGGGDGKPGGKKGIGKGENPREEADLAVEVDGAEDQRHETDVSAFAEVLRRRGFLLRGDPGDRPGPGAEGAVDLRNKMFVKMCFVKAAPAARGKCARPGQQGEGEGGGWRKGGSGSPKTPRTFVEAEEEQEDASPAEEAGVLKPCVYKTR